MLAVEGLTYTYPQRQRPALQDIDLHVQAGEAVLVAGRSGSGKSTLLRACNGLVPRFYGGRFAGRVVVGGLDTRSAAPALLAGKAGLVFQEPQGRFLTSTVADEIAFGLEIAGLAAATIRQRVGDILERLELTGLVDRPLDRLSGGEQQRVAIAAALARQPQLLVLDEPTSQLDGQSAEAVLAWVTELRHRLGLTALIAEHRLGRLLAAVDRVFYLPETTGAGMAGPPAAILERMPFGPPLSRLSRAWGLPAPISPESLETLRRKVLGLAPGAGRSLPAGQARLSASGLSFAYNGIPALVEVGLEVRPGEVLAVLGRNGSGKSTLLRVLMGLLRASRGEVRLDGERLDETPVPLRARRVGYVPQWPSALLFADSLLEELWITLRNHGLEEAPPLPPETLLRELGLTQVAGHYPRDLSAGEQQRAAIAAVLVARPGVVLLDEPTLGIDPLAQQEIGHLLDRWRGEGMAVVLATHDVEFAAAYSDRAMILDRGSVVAVGPTAETLFGQPMLRTALQQLTGRARPASPDELLNDRGPGEAHAEH